MIHIERESLHSMESVGYVRIRMLKINDVEIELAQTRQ